MACKYIRSLCHSKSCDSSRLVPSPLAVALKVHPHLRPDLNCQAWYHYNTSNRPALPSHRQTEIHDYAAIIIRAIIVFHCLAEHRLSKSSSIDVRSSRSPIVILLRDKLRRIRLKTDRQSCIWMSFMRGFHISFGGPSMLILPSSSEQRLVSNISPSTYRSRISKRKALASSRSDRSHYSNYF